jgi:hypothetical protein
MRDPRDSRDCVLATKFPTPAPLYFVIPAHAGNPRAPAEFCLVIPAHAGNPVRRPALLRHSRAGGNPVRRPALLRHSRAGGNPVHRPAQFRHSRAGGNPVHRRSSSFPRRRESSASPRPISSFPRRRESSASPQFVIPAEAGIQCIATLRRWRGGGNPVRRHTASLARRAAGPVRAARDSQRAEMTLGRVHTRAATSASSPVAARRPCRRAIQRFRCQPP